MNVTESFQVVSKTVDGKDVVAGVFDFFDTHGLPFDVIFELCKDNNMIPSWPIFYSDAIKAGWSRKTILNRLEPALVDVYGWDFANVVLSRL
jgi:alanyl-tRNA synthetase